MLTNHISDTIKYIGVDDHELDLFESQYMLEEGVSYNSYLIVDEQTVLMDSVDARMSEEWLKNLSQALAGKKLDYFVISHMEPDHGGSIAALLEAYPDLTIVSNAKAFTMLDQFFPNLGGERKTVAEGEELAVGSHTLKFMMAPMVHWPEVMVTYESSEKVLFSADGFGKFGTLDYDDPEGWTCEARRYYFNIVGKYGAPVQALLKKAAALDITYIAPLHGPILTGDLSEYIGLYDTWSKYEPEEKGVFIACASIHGHTMEAAEKLAEMLKEKGAEKVVLCDLAREDQAEAVEDAFRYDRLILCASSYDAGVFPIMDHFICHLRDKTYQNRTVGFMENGSWAPSAAKTMKTMVETFKNITIVEPTVTIRSAMKDSDLPAIEALADAMIR